MSTTKKFSSFINPIYWPIWLALGLLWLITRLPYRWQMGVGKGLGNIIYWSASKLKHISRINIQLCFPELNEEQRTTLLKKNFASLGIGLIEAARAWWLPIKKINHLFTVQGMEYAEQAFAKGKGIILLGPHFTCLEMVGKIVGNHYSFAAMYRPHKNPLIALIHERFRQYGNIQYIPRQNMRLLLRTLNNNVAVWYAYDIDGGKKRSVFAPLFGIPTASLTAVSRMARLSEAVVVPISFYRKDDLSYEVVLSPPLDNFPTDDLVADATRLNKILEAAIRHTPEQYVWQYKRFKTRPEGEGRFY